ncbi:MAG: hypothetical protein CMH60_07230 [Myxococcales bacterium]|nr:hypothetical protein [Myxococcales bacterium]
METVKIVHQGPLTKISLNRPEVRNAFNDKLVLELSEAFNTLPESTKVVVLNGEGPVFSAGADLAWMKASAAYTTEQNQAEALAMAKMFAHLKECNRVVIGQVHGAVMGGGIGLVSCCDMVVAGQSTKFAFSEVKLGLVPAVISPFVIAKIGIPNARRYFLTGEFFNAQQACDMGLVSKVVEDDNIDSAIEHLAKTVAANGPQALQACKSLLAHIETEQSDATLEFCATMIADLRASAEGQEGLSAFLEKRKPSWL